MHKRALLLATQFKIAVDQITDYLYHVTYFNRLPHIASQGLMPNKSRSIGSEAYTAHAKGRIFLTELAGVKYWYDKAEAFAEHNSDDIPGDAMVPVVLRIDINGIIDDLEEDVPGTTDSRVDAWIAANGIEPEHIEVFSGSEWLSMSEYHQVDIEQALDISDDGCYFKSPNPLIP